MATQAKETQISVPDRVVNSLMEGDRFARLLPECYRESAERWINRGKLYLLTCKNADKLQKCSTKSLVMSFLQGAEQGIPIDGKMGYLVPYGTEATFMASYIGLVAVARRHKLVVDAYARLLREHDEFDMQMEDGQFKVTYKPHIGTDPGQVIGAFAVLLFPGKRVVADFMNCDEIEAVRRRSKAAGSGPWVTDWGEMAKKTVLRRTIKTYVDDPEILALLKADDRDHGIIDAIGTEVEQPRKLHGARKAAPLRLASTQPEATHEEPASETQTQNNLADESPEFSTHFEHCESAAQCDEVFNDLLADDPTMQMQYAAARDWKKAQLK